MGADALLAIGKEALLLMLWVSMPPLLACLLAGVASGLFQAVTQVQESSLSILPKLGAAALALLLFGPWIGAQLARFASRLLNALPEVGL